MEKCKGNKNNHFIDSLYSTSYDSLNKQQKVVT